MKEKEEKEEEIIVICPHCNEFVVIEQLNCCIFRHAIMRNTNTQIDPHASKIVCEELKKGNLIFGCGKPFRIIIEGEKLITEICDYI